MLWAAFNGMLLVLQAQHACWGFYIVRKIKLSASVTILNNPKKQAR